MPWDWRGGLVAGRILSASPAAYATLGLLTLLLHELMPTGTTYAQFGWRIPFLIGAVLAFAVVITYRRSATEPPTQRSRTGGRRPLAELLLGPHRADLLQVLILMTGIWLANNMISAVLPQLMGTRLHLSPTQVSAAATANALGLVIAFQLYGALSQRTGRRQFYLIYGAVMAVVGGSLYATLMITTPGLPSVIIVGVAIGFATNAGFGPVAAYLTERFPSQIRATGFGVGYSLALVIPAFYAFYLTWLGRVMPSYLAPVVLIVIAGALVSIGAKLGPETRGVDLRR